ncbi:MAG: Gx transporter family protein [Acutalibacteraceae bacterium]|nr:Gx transporter family protein [Acutalibacteraceae bacterium]
MEQKYTAKMMPKFLWLTQTALFSAVAVILAALESMLPDFPIPLPGVKLGLSNIATMFATQSLGLASGLTAALFKAVFAGLTRGGVAFIMSLAGGVLSTLVFYLFVCVKSNCFGYVGIGISCAVVHNTAQLGVAALLTDSSVFIYYPVLLLASLAAGAVTGIAVGITMPAFRKIRFL